MDISRSPELAGARKDLIVKVPRSREEAISSINQLKLDLQLTDPESYAALINYELALDTLEQVYNQSPSVNHDCVRDAEENRDLTCNIAESTGVHPLLVEYAQIKYLSKEEREERGILYADGEYCHDMSLVDLITFVLACGADPRKPPSTK